MANIRPTSATMGKQDSSWKRVKVPCVLWCLVLVIVFGQCAGGKPMSETLQRALSAVRGPSPGAKKLLNIPEDGADPLPGKHVPLESYESELEKEHALPTSVPNADILKTNSNPTYHKPRPPQHHGASLLAGVGGGAVPSYAPPGRAFFTPPLPPEYRNPFADKPTLRGTNTDGNNYLNRRPIPPPSLGPGHERIPIRPPGQETSSPQVPAPPPAPPLPPAGVEPQKKKALNTPSHKPDELDDVKHGTDQANFTVPHSLNIPTISRILSGSNGRKEDIPDVLLRTVTAKPQHNQERTSKSDIYVTKDAGVTLSDTSRDMSTEGSVLAVLDPEMNNLDRPLIVDQNGETNTRRNLQYSTNKENKNDSGRDDSYTPATTIGFELRDPEMSTERYHNLANVNSDKKILKQDPKNNGPVQRPGVSWPFAWNVHIYLATVMFTILAVYSIFKIFFYNRFTHLFTQYYFIILHLILVSVCLMRIFYMCYDPYNINSSLPVFFNEILLHVPDIFLSIAFASTTLFLLTTSINFKNTCCSFLFRARTIIVGGILHVLSCLMLHIFENSNTIYRAPNGVEKRVLGLTCQIIFIMACLTLGLCYLYVYKMLKSVLKKKSHTYVNGFQNLYQAIQINLATALLFILMAILQIFGIFGINQVNMAKLDWLQWGYQSALRFIEITIIALISWVISLKVSIVASLQQEKADGNKLSGLGLFPCAAGSSNDQFESDYPTICSTNTNLHTYTHRTGKPIYEGAGHHPAMPDQFCTPIDHQRFQLNTLTGNCDNNSGTENYSAHSSIANAGHSSSTTESSNATSSQGVTNHLIKHHPNMVAYNGMESVSDDHYSNCDPAIQSLQGDDPMDHEYNVIQYPSNSDFIRDMKNQNYNGGSNRSSHNFKHMSYDRVSSRTNSNPRKKHRAKNKIAQNSMTLGYDGSMEHHYHQPHLPDEYGNYNTENASYHASGIQTLNPNRSFGPCQQVRNSQRRNSPSTSMVNSSGSQKRGKNSGFPDRPKSTDMYGFTEDPNDRNYPNALANPQPAPRNCGYEASYSQPQDEVNPEADGNSMLVAQNGFVRFRPLEDDPSQT
ncbi:uncharacterized protein LOC106142769 isoform X1 [Amyelois transitella]|uniref:uncharacterized protein LOC106142769 isoform X1 n=1 Tax=Amyelois transitella TaxID=680683 RepID=UPI00067B4A0B|nr:uncharacterized protein LOC106142769 isoform X1 [Amyelois transitella]XP_060807655.1 uncharacterized protein LOC106142769 isoform X1 [Amyelois transitella]